MQLSSVGTDTTHSGTIQHDALGFMATSFSGWDNRPPSTAPEPLWLFLNSSTSSYLTTEITNNAAWDNFLTEIATHSASTHLSNFTIRNQVTSIATVPLPGAVWMLAAALACLRRIPRRRHSAPTLATA